MADVVFRLRNIAALNLHNLNELAEDQINAGVLNISQTALKMFDSFFLFLFFYPFHHLQFIFLHAGHQYPVLST